MLNISAFGTLGRDPDFRTLESGQQVVNFSVAIRIPRTDVPTWLKCTCWGKQAELIASSFKKGSRIAFSGNGELKTREYEGTEYTDLCCTVNSFSFVEKKSEQDSEYDDAF